MTKCDRCRRQTQWTIMSRFNTEDICDDCEKQEKAHPSYRAAAEAELRAVRAGNYNFRGIGKPSDL